MRGGNTILQPAGIAELLDERTAVSVYIAVHLDRSKLARNPIPELVSQLTVPFVKEWPVQVSVGQGQFPSNFGDFFSANAR